MEHGDIKKDTNWKAKVFDSLNFPILILKPDKTIIEANEIFLATYDTARDKVLGRKCYEFFNNSTEPCPDSECSFEEVLATKKGDSMLISLNTPEGEEIWKDRIFSPILDDEGKVAYVLETERDLTRRKAMEKEVEVARNFVVKIIESSASAIVAADIKGRIMLMNPAAEDLFGYSVSEVIGKNIIEYFYMPGEARAIMKKIRDPQLGGKGKLPIEKTTIINAQGEEIPVEMTAAIVYEGGREIATMAIYNDLREKLAVQKKLERIRLQLFQSEKMASMGQLAAGVAHEINNPLAGILIYASLTLEKVFDNSLLQEYLTYIIEDANRCKDIVKHLLAYSRQTSSNKSIIQINELLDKSLNLIRDQAILRNVEIVKEVSSENMSVRVDGSQISQLILNLIMNAVDAMNSKGILTFRTYCSKKEEKVYLEISDTGCGIPDRYVSKIFDPFFTTKEPGEGTGLGLSTAYGIIEEHKGRISVKKTGSDGTTFLVEFPLDEALEAVEDLTI